MSDLKKTDSKKTIRKILRYIKRHIPLVVLSIILAAIIVFLTLYIPILIGNAVDVLLAGKGNIDFEELIRIMKRSVLLWESRLLRSGL